MFVLHVANKPALDRCPICLEALQQGHVDRHARRLHPCHRPRIEAPEPGIRNVYILKHYCPANERGAGGKFFQYRELFAI